MSKSKYEPIRDYLDFEDLLEKSGYRIYRPKMSSFLKAVLEASKHQGRSSFINRMLDVYFKKLRQQKKQQKGQNNNNVIQKQNSRHHLQSNASDNNKTSFTSSIKSDGCTTDR